MLEYHHDLRCRIDRVQGRALQRAYGPDRLGWVAAIERACFGAVADEADEAVRAAHPPPPQKIAPDA